MSVKKSPIYHAWGSMRKRCLNPRRPDYYRYGGRGIGICARWDGTHTRAHRQRRRLHARELHLGRPTRTGG